MSNSGFLDEKPLLHGIERLAPQGGTSEAFIVKADGKNLFMKRLRPEFAGDTKYRTIFEKEYELGRSIESPYFPEYMSLNSDKEGMYILMEYVYGENIEGKLESDPAYFHSTKNIQKLLLQLLEGLEVLHRKDILYLDFNPKNIMLTKFGSNVKITDLGFCANAAYHHTAGSTPGFSAPEVEEKRLDGIDAQSDIYSVGLLLRYIKERSGAKLTRRQNSFMQRCLKKEKKERFHSAKDAIQFLKHSSTWKFVAFAVAAVCCILAATILLTPPLHKSRQTATFLLTPPPQALESRQTATFNGVEYCILSHEAMTCAVTGGEGKDGNIYVEPQMTIDGREYRTVAIKDSAFNERDILSIDIPEGIETIGNAACNYCKKVVTLSIPGSVKDYSGAFVRMHSLTKVKIPATKEISSAAFVDCRSLVDIFIPEGVERICRDAFVSCTALKNVSLPQTLTVLERGVFYNCTSLKEITIPATVKEIGDYAFYECKSLHSIYLHATTPPRITAIINTAGVTVYVPAEALNAYKKDFNWNCYNLEPMQKEQN